jgi:hypothetical protein
MDILISFGLGTTVYALYLQFNPKIGNIWIRKDHENNNVLALNNLYNMMVIPFTNIYFWKPENLDLNVFTWYISIYGGIKIIRCFMEGKN